MIKNDKKSKKWLKFLILILKISNNTLLWSKLLYILPISFCIKILSSSSALIKFNETFFLPLTNSNIDFWRTLMLVINFKKKINYKNNINHTAPYFYNNFLLNLLYKWIGSKVLLNLIPYKGIDFYEFSDLLLINKAIYPALKRLHHRFFYKDLLSVFFIALAQKNSYFLLTWVTRLMQRLPSKFHRKFLYFLSIFLTRLSEIHPNPSSYIGIRFSISGKISVTGNAKTRTKHLAIGKRSLSTKKLSISFSQKQIRTLTGVLGIRCYIFY